MNRIRICGQIINNYEQIIELSDKELIEFRKELNIVKNKHKDQAIDDFLGENYGDNEPINWECREWSATLIKDDDSTIEFLDH